MKLLIPSDGSALSLQVLWSLRALFDREETEVVLFRAVPEGADLEAATRSSTELVEVQRLLEDQEVRVSVRLETGDPAERIVACAAEVSADWIAMASHGHTGLERFVRGSTAERVLRRSPIPVLLTTPHTRLSEGPEFRRILVPHDGSPAADAILPDVERIARAYESEVTLLRAESALLQPPPRFDPAHWSPERLEHELAVLNAPRDALVAAGIAVQRQVAYGRPAAEIVAAATRSDLVAMTTHGRSGLSQWLFGSVAEAVFRRLECPLLVRRSTA